MSELFSAAIEAAGTPDRKRTPTDDSQRFQRESAHVWQMYAQFPRKPQWRRLRICAIIISLYARTNARYHNLRISAIVIQYADGNLSALHLHNQTLHIRWSEWKKRTKTCKQYSLCCSSNCWRMHFSRFCRFRRRRRVPRRTCAPHKGFAQRASATAADAAKSPENCIHFDCYCCHCYCLSCHCCRRPYFSDC